MTGPMVTWVPGQRLCTASAITCAASCRISSNASGSVRDTILTLASSSIGSAKSASLPSTTMATPRLASDLEMLSARALPLMPRRTERLAPSGKVTMMSFTGVSLAAYHAGKMNPRPAATAAQHVGRCFCPAAWTGVKPRPRPDNPARARKSRTVSAPSPRGACAASVPRPPPRLRWNESGYFTSRECSRMMFTHPADRGLADGPPQTRNDPGRPG